jgi:hypothetical protein
MVRKRYFMRIRQITRRFLAAASLVALMVTSVSGLTEALAASNLPGCCNSVCCPLHHRQSGGSQKDKSNCGAMGVPGQNDCSMRTCDPAPSPVVTSVAFVLAPPIALQAPAGTQPTPIQAPEIVLFVASIPSTPPPRISPS